MKWPIVRERTSRCVKQAQTPTMTVLVEADLAKLHANVDWEDVLEVQRWNLLLLGFRSGLRAETIWRLRESAICEKVIDEKRSATMHRRLVPRTMPPPQRRQMQAF